MRIRVMTTGIVLGVLALVFALTGWNGVIPVAQAQAPSIVVSPDVIAYKDTKKLIISGTGFTPGSVVTVGVEGVGRWKKEAPAAKDLWVGLASVKEDQTFTVEVSLGDSLWRVKGLSGKYTVLAKDDEGKRATAPLTIEPEKKGK